MRLLGLLEGFSAGEGTNLLELYRDSRHPDDGPARRGFRAAISID
jgi:hypothetical protein